MYTSYILCTLAEGMELQYLPLMCLSEASVIPQLLQKMNEKQNSCIFSQRNTVYQHFSLYKYMHWDTLNLNPAFAG